MLCFNEETYFNKKRNKISLNGNIHIFNEIDHADFIFETNRSQIFRPYFCLNLWFTLVNISCL